MKKLTFYQRKEVTTPGDVPLVEPQLDQGTSPREKFNGVYSTRGFKRTGTDYALLFATNEYDHWENLTTPINDAKALRDELEKYGFEVKLYEDKKTGEMATLLDEYTTRTYETEDQLLVYFTGHGLFEKDRQDGLIAGKNSAAPIGVEDLAPGDYRSYLTYADLERMLDRLKCNRILLILDVCYGGTFDQEIALGEPPSTKGAPSTKGVKQALDLAETLKVKTRWYLSAGEKEEVLAASSTGEHSPFAAALLSILKGDGDVLSDDVLTIPEIEQHLPWRVKVEADKAINAYKKETGWSGEWKNQTPASGHFGTTAKETDKAFVFIKTK